MKNIFKGLGLGLVTSALVLGMGAVSALAATTYAVNAITETGALAITGTGTGTTAALAGVGLAGGSAGQHDRSWWRGANGRY